MITPETEMTDTPQPPIVRPATKPPARKAAAKAPALVPVQKKPFRMSYDGTTDRDYIAHRLNLGAR